jgi:hypothetical protein
MFVSVQYKRLCTNALESISSSMIAMCCLLLSLQQAALGPGGLAGSFSAAAASVLSVLRGSGELLTALLALLLADPAVDWSVEREAHAARKDQDTSVSLKLFASR